MNVQTRRAVHNEIHFNGRQVRCYAERPAHLLEFFDSAIRRSAAGDALIDEATRLTYLDLDQLADSVARLLSERGLRTGDRLVLLTGNCAAFGVITLAAWRLGLIVVPLNPRNVRDEVSFVMGQCSARGLVFEADLADRVPAAAAIPHCIAVIDAAALIDAGRRSAPAPFARARPAEEDVAVLLYTSGTTGRPKGAMLTHFNLIQSSLHFADTMALREGNERSLLAVPISHVTGIVAIWLSMVAVAGCMVMVREFKAAPFLRTMAAERITHTVLVPAIYNLLLREPSFKSTDLSAWRLGGYGGAPMPEVTIEALASALPGLGLMNAYGATETTSPVTIMPAAEQRAHLDSVGRLMPCATVRVVDDNGQDVAPGESGELWIAGPMVVPGYWDNPEATAREFSDGYWHSGDIGSIDAQGYVRVLDRKKDMINRGGYKVYSAEVESVLLAHAAVIEAAVLGQPDAVLGERTRAIVVMRPGASASDALLEEIRQHCRQHLADYKVPDFLEARTEPLPRNPNGKVLKRMLRA